MTITIKEKSLQLALIKGAGQLGITQDELAYRIVDESQGFLGFGKSVAIKVWHKRNPPPPEPEKRNEKRTLDPEENTKLQEGLREFCANICTKVSGTPNTVDISTTLDDDRFILDVQNDDIANILQKNNRFAESMEHLLRKQPRHIHQELPFRIFFDANGTRQSREKELAHIAKDLSAQVHESKRPIVLNYRSSYDRKIIHMALDRDKRVYTKSIGNGAHRKLMILPIREDFEKAAT